MVELREPLVDWMKRGLRRCKYAQAPGKLRFFARVRLASIRLVETNQSLLSQRLSYFSFTAYTSSAMCNALRLRNRISS
jgi:hypothetical protein